MAKTTTTPRPTPAQMRAMIQAARAGDREQRARVLEIFRPYLVVRSFTKLDPRVQVKVAPSDAAQVTIIKALKGFSRFGGEDPEGLLRWLDRIHARCVLDLHRRYMHADKRSVVHERRLDGVESQEFLKTLAQAVAKVESPSETFARKVRADEVRAAFDRLTARQRDVLELRYLRGLTFDEIGSQLGIQPSAARQAKFRGLQSIAEILRIRK